ncbi:MAG: TadE/TadG family type IV pilus assembly protein [Candidatus Nitrosoglobus sp.]
MNTPEYFSRRGGQRGLAMTEFVIVLPVMLLLMLATAELGRAFYQYNILTKAVRDGARYLASNAIQGTTGVINISGAQAATKNLVVYGNTTGNGSPLLEGWSTSDVTTVEAVDTTHVRVEAQYKFKPIFSKIPTFGFGKDINLGMTFRASVIMRAL